MLMFMHMIGQRTTVHLRPLLATVPAHVIACARWRCCQRERKTPTWWQTRQESQSQKSPAEAGRDE
jgi:hypothetical protein